MPIDDPSLIGVADKPGSDSMDGIENSQDSGKSNSDANGTRESSAASLHHDESHCSELWPERYGWEATKRFDNHIDCGFHMGLDLERRSFSIVANWYLHLYQGQGGVFELPVEKMCYDGERRFIDAVGSAGSHIAASIHLQDRDRGKKIWSVTEEQGTDLETYIHKKLSEDERLVELVRSEKYQRSVKKAVCCCPHPDRKGRKSFGRHIIDAIENFFDLKGVKVQAAHGLVVEHRSPPEAFLCRYRWEEEDDFDARDEMWRSSDDESIGERNVNEEGGEQANAGSSNEMRPSSGNGSSGERNANDRSGQVANIGLSNEMRPSSGAGERRETDADDNGDQSENNNGRASEGDGGARVPGLEEIDRPRKDMDENAAGAETQSSNDGTPQELWPADYGWEGVKRVVGWETKEFGRPVNGEWNLVWRKDGGGWRSGPDRLHVELECLEET
ncbi:uncharacterized protein CLAFUR5_04963 [Fulvia fulva]|uniref:Uncharacterized protein n=1 Tax=Passalora fulva TaxID=5499 RepID=A0A9Q8LGJ4_PASFU|nr:uncharacterized protein CLAFUR5_04963 [Fulvia fulva]KAK4617080.1 hypothetical protein CLAFUR0_10352 [Fulvia fulva]UJO16223.1 hypothetical protein CLAFUR5_04963 [Fulvia fulva]